MATATTTEDTITNITLRLDADEVSVLRQMMQNPLRSDEGGIEHEVRTAIFTALQEKG